VSRVVKACDIFCVTVGTYLSKTQIEKALPNNNTRSVITIFNPTRIQRSIHFPKINMLPVGEERQNNNIPVDC